MDIPRHYEQHSELKNTETMEYIHMKLCNTVLNADVDLVQDYLQKGADVNYTADDGWTLLHWAAWRGNTAVDNDEIKPSGRIPIHLSARWAYLDLIKVLLEAGASLSAVDNDVIKHSVKLIQSNIKLFK